jgi:SAM-dependent methyltransferase
MRAAGDTYLGVDYVQEMVDHCRAQFPGVRFERADARHMPQFPDGSFDVVMFSCNGICMVDHAGRLAILSEVRRLLSPEGVFIFSTCNRNSPQFEASFRFPDLQRTWNPAKAMVRAGRFALQTAQRLRNRWRYRRHEVRVREYAVVNDVCHHYQTMLYFIGVPEQWLQLAQAGFVPAAPVFDLQGQPASAACRDGTLAFVARKA